MSVEELVDTTIANNTVALFSKSYCPYCKKAKALFASKYPQVKVEILELDQREDGDEIQKFLAEKTSQRTVPNIFIKQKHIGGSSDLIALEEKGQLKQELI